MAKIEAMQERIGTHQPSTATCHCVDALCATENWPGHTSLTGVDAVIDACDQVKAKTAMAHWARRTNVSVLLRLRG
jgi:tRNA A37 threonylcarbamoyladenosine dehydratase